MSLNFLEELKKAPPKKRAKLLHEMHEKNVKFFTRKNPQLGQFIQEAGTGGYNIILNNEFLEVIHVETGELCHPKTGLERYVKELGSSHHSGWIDKLKVSHVIPPGIEHGEKIENFLVDLYTSFPSISNRMSSGEVSLPKTQNKKRFSSMTIFLGTFLGFHIAHYLLNTEIRDIVIVEPDLEKFALSCWFLDFEAIERIFKRLVLHVGPDMPITPEAFIDNAGISSTVWLRLLPAYPSSIFDEVIHRFELRWRALSEIFVPFDREVRNLVYGMKNMQLHRPINYISPQLSNNSCIAIVASGPSLDKELDWLKENQHKLIIFAAHSAVKILKKHNIRPDFQCSLDTELDSALLDRLELDPEIPFISYYKANPESLKRFNTILLVNEYGKANPVKFSHPLHYTHPTTGNLMLSVACYARPKKILLIGLDLGTKNTNKDHAKGYWAENTETETIILTKQQMIEQGLIPVVANFSESEGQIYTHAYHNTARKSVEAQLYEVANIIEVFNLSDGAKINYCQAKHSSNYMLPEYPEKQKDIQCFKNSFISILENESLYKQYQKPFSKLLETAQLSVEKTLKLKAFSLFEFVVLLDDVWTQIVHDCKAEEAEDIRIEAYGKLIMDLLTEWYRLMIFTRTPKEAEEMYKKGLNSIISILKTLKTPCELSEEKATSSQS